MLQIRPLRPCLAKTVKELGETPETLARDVKIIRDWIAQEPHLIVDPSDQFIVSYLRACRYSIEKFKKKYEAQITVRTQLSHIFHNRDILSERYQNFLKLGFMFTLPLSLTEEGPTVYIFRPGCYDPNVMHFEDVMGSMSPIIDVGTEKDDNFTIHGYIMIVDATLSLNILMQIHPTFLVKILNYFQKSSPLIINSIHIINMQKFVEPIFNVVKSLVSSKTIPKIHVHRTVDTIYKFVPQKIMPKDYGGYGPTLEECITECTKRINSNADMLKDLDKNVTDESKRLVPLEGSNNVHGTFRQLNFD